MSYNHIIAVLFRFFKFFGKKAGRQNAVIQRGPFTLSGGENAIDGSEAAARLHLIFLRGSVLSEKYKKPQIRLFTIE